ncbi:MAG: metal-dependent transcriptional regulator [Candidatus Bathyarchaeota archaeon]|nr:metal-dependent transcriptional regulator [Candidatus Bathyarchaeota archaeon]
MMHPVTRLNAAKETYIKTIAALVKKHGCVGVSDIAKALNVKPSSVTEMLKKLGAQGFVAHEPYCSVTLTVKGQNLAVFLKQQQASLQRFFVLLDVDEQIAKQDACKTGHVLHEATLKRLTQYVTFLENPKYSENCVDCFRAYLKNIKQQ